MTDVLWLVVAFVVGSIFGALITSRLILSLLTYRMTKGELYLFQRGKWSPKDPRSSK